MDKLALSCLKHNYGQFFDVVRLKSDLVGIYNYEMLKSKSIKDLTFRFENDLNSIFCEIVTTNFEIGTEVSAKCKGAYCEAKITQIENYQKFRIQEKNGKKALVEKHNIIGNLTIDSCVKFRFNVLDTWKNGIITKISDYQRYHVVFDDGDTNTLKPSQLVLKGEKYFKQTETLDDMPLTSPERFGSPVVKNLKNLTISAVSKPTDVSNNEETSSIEGAVERSPIRRTSALKSQVLFKIKKKPTRNHKITNVKKLMLTPFKNFNRCYPFFGNGVRYINLHNMNIGNIKSKIIANKRFSKKKVSISKANKDCENDNVTSEVESSSYGGSSYTVQSSKILEDLPVEHLLIERNQFQFDDSMSIERLDQKYKTLYNYRRIFETEVENIDQHLKNM
ncbi:hypothetical protein A3Q56_06772 [Intoshia linei]|uniref:Tudor domain-containing protein n=1 Tax=Intoshia linei TaxID=1819745 RepID=A0A177AVD8_9BILA|nr:hypothetical protein A3Q56_06772 [Intoshia linei]